MINSCFSIGPGWSESGGQVSPLEQNQKSPMQLEILFITSVLLPVSCFDLPVSTFSRSLLPSKCQRNFAGVLTLRAQLDKTTAVGWIGRPSSAVSNVQETDARAEIRMSVTGDLKLEGGNIKCGGLFDCSCRIFARYSVALSLACCLRCFVVYVLLHLY